MNCFTDYIKDHSPVYEGLNRKDHQTVSVHLKEWFEGYCFGNGSVFPYPLASIYGESNPNEGSFDLNDREITFRHYDDINQIVLSLKVSKDFKRLKIIDQLSSEVLGHLEEKRL